MNQNPLATQTGPYWWHEDTGERYWVEIRHRAGLGTELRCPLTDVDSKPNAWYDLLDAVRTGDIVYHWHARQSRFVGRSEAASTVQRQNNERVVPLIGFQPLVGDVDLARLRAMDKTLAAIRDSLQARYANRPLYLPFQYRDDGLRLMSNYFAKLPRVMVETIFGTSGVADAGALEPPPEDGPPDKSLPRLKTRFLEPFRPKADADYVAYVRGGPQQRGRRHETLVNSFTDYLTSKGLSPGRNQAIDVGLETPPAIVEAKVVESWSLAIRQAVGQLYEYRFFQVTTPESGLIFLASAPVPDKWLQYLEEDRGIGVAWQTAQGFELTPRAQRILKLV